VNAIEVAEYESHQPDEPFDVETGLWPYKATLLVCVCCKALMLAHQNDDGYPDEPEYGPPSRVYPPQDATDLPLDIPEGIRNSLEEARKCLKVKAYSAAAVMCGRALEGICRHFNAGTYLGKGLTELQKQGLIDTALVEWGAQIQEHRNIGAHANDTVIEEKDAVDLFDFAHAICNYIFVLSEKFRKFRERRGLPSEQSNVADFPKQPPVSERARGRAVAPE
jgi:hypothetical protein